MIVATRGLGQAPIESSTPGDRLANVATAFRWGAIVLGLFVGFHLYKAGSR